MAYRYKLNRMANNMIIGFMGLGFLLTIIRWISAFNGDFVVINQEINSHINNFSLSMMFYLAVGNTWLLQGVSLKKIIIFGILIVLGNILCETVMGFMNTPDIIDAIYGIIGTIISFIALWLIQKKWLIVIGEEKS